MFNKKLPVPCFMLKINLLHHTGMYQTYKTMKRMWDLPYQLVSRMVYKTMKIMGFRQPTSTGAGGCADLARIFMSCNKEGPGGSGSDLGPGETRKRGKQWEPNKREDSTFFGRLGRRYVSYICKSILNLIMMCSIDISTLTMIWCVHVLNRSMFLSWSNQMLCRDIFVSAIIESERYHFAWLQWRPFV